MDSTDDRGNFPVKDSSDINRRIRLGDAMINRPHICYFFCWNILLTVIGAKMGCRWLEAGRPRQQRNLTRRSEHDRVRQIEK